MRAVFSPSLARGSVTAPPSKSMAHRALFCAALAKGESRVGPIASSEDMLATLDVLQGLGASFRREGDSFFVTGADSVGKKGGTLFCRESGSTLRFSLPLCLISGEEFHLTGVPRLLERPLGVYAELCKEKGFSFSQKKEGVTLSGRLYPGTFSVPGNVSSQFITGLLFALPCLGGESVLRVTGELESAPYVAMTLWVMERFGVKVKREGNCFFIPNASYQPCDFTVEGDASNAAFLEGFSLLGGCVSVAGLSGESLQGDRVYRDLYPALRAGCPKIDLRDCPDLGPVLMALGAALNGVVLTGTRRLKMKESDRGAAMAAELKKCGASLFAEEDCIRVEGGGLVRPVEALWGWNDHRIVMALSLVLSRVGGVIEGAEAVGKSYPEFFKEIKKLGIEVNLV